ncbi:MAG TPA: hypothetical protein DCP91_09395 [Eggerthellaceae bacterium]|nr:hypothetical protein [Eggerthellaceae bacterium]
MNWKAWTKAAGIRAIKTIAQSAIATIGTAAAIGQVDWRFVLSASLLAGLLSILTSIAGIPEVNNGVSPLDSSTDKDAVDDYKG